FLPRRPRIFGACVIAALQVMILLTGNYTFFNWLTLVLCIIACDDFAWSSILPRRLSKLYNQPAAPTKIFKWKNVPITLFTIFIASISLVQIIAALGSL